jgi:capsular polysaccharide biosynthesis protein
VTAAGLMQAPEYEASVLMLVGWQQEDQWPNLAGSGEEIQTLEYREPPTQTMAHAIHSRPVAAETIGRLDLPMEPEDLLDNLTIEQVEGTQFIRLTYEDTNPEEAARIANTFGQVSSERISELVSESSAGDGQLSATVWEKAAVPENPVSPRPLWNGLLTLIVGLSLAVVLPQLRLATARVKSRPLPDPALRRVARREVEAAKEQELLEALKRGRLTAVEASLATSLSVDEASRMLYELAVRGHLEVTVERGRLLYSFWSRDVK